MATQRLPDYQERVIAKGEKSIPMVGFDTYDEAIRKNLWKLYVEACTRISLRELPDDVGDEGEALDSLYKVFTLARECLIGCYHHIPDFNADQTIEEMGEDTYQRSACSLIITFMEHLRPFVSRWHTKRLAGCFEEPQDLHTKRVCKEFRQELRKLQVGEGSKMGVKQILNLILAFGRFPNLIDFEDN